MILKVCDLLVPHAFWLRSYAHATSCIIRLLLVGSNILVNDQGVVKLADFGASKKVSQSNGMMMTMTVRGTPYFMAPEVFEVKYGYESDIWGVGCVAVQMITGLPPWKDLGVDNPVLLYNHIKKNPGPPPIKLSMRSPEETAFTSLLAKCFRQDPTERPSASELQDEVFFLQRECHDDNLTGIHSTSIFASPAAAKDTSYAWEHLLSPSTPHSAVQRRHHHRSNSTGCMKPPFASPPIPENFVLNIPNIQHRQTPLASPGCDPSEWPSWARKAMVVPSEDTKEAPNTPVIKSVSDTLGVGSLAISEDSTAPAELEKRNLFCNSNRDYFSEASEVTTTVSTPLQGIQLLETIESCSEH